MTDPAPQVPPTGPRIQRAPTSPTTPSRLMNQSLIHLFQGMWMGWPDLEQAHLQNMTTCPLMGLQNMIIHTHQLANLTLRMLIASRRVILRNTIVTAISLQALQIQLCLQIQRDVQAEPTPYMEISVKKSPAGLL